ncbi:MAG: FlgD immunoglobulin-like domain containing protein [Candidatus Wallbacteria bacterium]|nr:FlgD immunoglobulin-like domain containing protein [Candidatus Wallbacteria bacterium]
MSRFLSLVLILIFISTTTVWAYPTVSTYDNATPTDNDGFYHAGQNIRIKLLTTEKDTSNPPVLYQYGTCEVSDGSGVKRMTYVAHIGYSEFYYVWNTTSLAQGTYTIDSLYSTDEIRNQSVSQSSVILDNTKPTCTGVTSASGSVHANAPWGNETVTFTLNFSDTGGSGLDTTIAPTVKLGGVSGTVLTATTGWSGTSWTGSCSTAGLNGSCQIVATGVTDRAGNVMDTYNGSSYSVNTDLPTVSGVATVPAQPTTFYNGQSVTFNITFSEDMNQSVACSASFCGVALAGSWQDATHWSGSVTIPSGKSGSQALTITNAQDTMGNVMASDATHTFNVDSVKPTVTGVVATPNPPGGADASHPFTQCTITLALTFSKDMNGSVAPTVTLDGHSVSGSYSDTTHWSGNVTVTTFAVWGGLSARTLSISTAKDTVGNTMDTDTAHSYWVDASIGDADLDSVETYDSATPSDCDEKYHAGQQIVLYLHTKNDTTGGKATAEVREIAPSAGSAMVQTAMVASGPYGSSEYGYTTTWNTTGRESGTYRVYFYYGNGKNTTIDITLDATVPYCSAFLLRAKDTNHNSPFSDEVLCLKIYYKDDNIGGSTYSASPYNTGIDTSSVVVANLSGVGAITVTYFGTGTYNDGINNYTYNIWSGEITVPHDAFNGTSTLTVGGVKDIAGNARPNDTTTHVLDTSNPTVASVTPLPAAPFIGGASESFTIVFSDPNGTKMSTTAEMKVSLVFSSSPEILVNPSSGGWQADSLTWKGTAASAIPAGWNGDCKLLIIGARDQVWHWLEGKTLSTDTYETTFAVDTSQPTVEVSPTPPGPLHFGLTTFEVRFSDTMDIAIVPTITLNGQALTANPGWSGDKKKWNGQITIDESFNGTKELSVSGAKDTAGNLQTPDPATFQYSIDATPPTLEVVTTPSQPYHSLGVDLPADGPFILNQKVTFEIVFTEIMKTSETLTVKFGGKTVVAVGANKGWTTSETSWIGVYTIESSLGDGTKELSISGAHDKNGNPLETDPDTSHKYPVDVTKPIISSIKPTSPDWFRSGEIVTFGITFTEAMTTESTLTPPLPLTPEVFLLQINPKATLEVKDNIIWSDDCKTWTGSVTIDGTIFTSEATLSLEVMLGHDAAGNTMEINLSKLFYTDFKSPTLEIAMTGEDLIYKNTDTMHFWASSEAHLRSVEVANFTVNSNGPDSKQTDTIELAESPLGIYKGTLTIHSTNTATTGSHEVQFYGFDTAENLTMKTLEVYLDNIAPIVAPDTWAVSVTPSISGNILTQETAVFTIYFYDSSEAADTVEYGMDYTRVPTVMLGSYTLTNKGYTAEVINGHVYEKYTGELSIVPSMQGNLALQISRAYDVAGNVMTAVTSGYTYEVNIGAPTVSTFKMYHNGRLLNNSLDYIGIGKLTAEIIFSDTMETSFTPEISIDDGLSVVRFSTSEGTFVTTARLNDTYRSGTVETTAPVYTLAAGAVTVEVANAYDKALNKMVTTDYKGFIFDNIRPTLETVVYDKNNRLIYLTFSENIRSSATPASVNPNLHLFYDTKNVDIFAGTSTKFQGYTISNRTMTVTLKQALADATYEIVVGDTTSVSVTDMAWNTLDTSDVSLYKKEIDFKAPVLSSFVIKDYYDPANPSLCHNIDSVNWFLKYHTNDLVHSNADSVEADFVIYEPDQFDTTSTRLYWKDAFGESNSLSASLMSFSGNQGTISVTVKAVNLAAGCGNIGRSGIVKFWVTGSDTIGNPFSFGNSETSPAATAEVRWLQPVTTLEAEVNPRIVYPGRDFQMKVSLAPKFNFYDSGIEKLIINNLPSTPSNFSMDYIDQASVTHPLTISVDLTTPTSATLSLYGGNNLDAADLVKTLEVFFTVTAKSAVDAPAGVTVEVKADNVTTSSYSGGYTNPSCEVKAVAGEIDGVDNDGNTPIYIFSRLNIQTRKPADSAVAEINPYLVWPNRTSAEVTYYIYPTISITNNAWVNRAVILLDGLKIKGTKEIRIGGTLVGGSSWSGLSCTWETSAYNSTAELIFSDSEPLKLSQTIEATFYVDSGPENLTGKAQKSWIDFCYPGMNYPQINMQTAVGNADSNPNNANTQTLYIMQSAGGGSLALTPTVMTPDPYRVNKIDLTATVSPLIPAGSPGINFFRLYFVSPQDPDSFEAFSLTSVKVASQTVGFSYNSAQFPGAHTIEITLDNAVSVSQMPVEIAFKMLATRGEVTGELVCGIANSQNMEFVPAGTVEIKSGYPANSTAMTTLEVLMDGVPTGKFNVSTDSDVTLRYTTTLEVDALNTGVDRLLMILPSNNKLSSPVLNQLIVDSSTVEVLSASVSGSTMEIRLKNAITTSTLRKATVEIYFSGHTTSTANDVLPFNLYVDNVQASSPVPCVYNGLFVQQQLNTKRLVTNLAYSVTPNLVAPLDAISYHHYQVQVDATLTGGSDAGIQKFKLSLPNHLNLTVEAIAVSGIGTDSVAIINSKEVTLTTPITDSRIVTINFKAQPPRTGGISVLDYPTGQTLSLWVDNPSIISPKLVTNIRSGGSSNIAVAGVIAGGTLEINNPYNTAAPANITVNSREIVTLTFKPSIPVTHAGIKSFKIYTSNATMGTTEITIAINGVNLNTIYSGTPAAGEALASASGNTLEITLGSVYGSTYSDRLFQVWFPITALAQGQFNFAADVYNSGITGSLPVTISVPGDVDPNYSNNSNSLKGVKSIIKPNTAYAWITPGYALTTQTKTYTYYISFDANPGSSFAGIDSVEITIPSQFTYQSSPAPTVAVYRNSLHDNYYDPVSPPVYNSSSHTLSFKTGDFMTGATFEVQTTITLVAPSQKYASLDFPSQIRNSGDTISVIAPQAKDYNGDGTTDRTVKVSANATSVMAEVTPNTVPLSADITFNLAILPTVQSNDNGLNKIIVTPASTYHFKAASSSEVISYLSVGSTQYTYVTSEAALTGHTYVVNYQSGRGSFEILLGDTLESTSASVVRIIFAMSTPSAIDAPSGTALGVLLDNKNYPASISAASGDVVNYISSNSLRIVANVTQIISVDSIVQATYSKKWKVQLKVRFSSDMDTSQTPSILFASSAHSGTRYPLTQISYNGNLYVGEGTINYSDTTFGGSIEIYGSNCKDVYGNLNNLQFTSNLHPGFAIGYFFAPLVNDQLMLVCQPSETLKSASIPEIWVTQNNKESVKVTLSQLTGSYYKGTLKVSTEDYYLGDGVIAASGIDHDDLAGSTEVSFTVVKTRATGGSLSSPDRLAGLTYPARAFKDQTLLFLLPQGGVSSDPAKLSAPSSTDGELVSVSPTYLIGNGLKPELPLIFSLNQQPVEKAGLFYLDLNGKWKWLHEKVSGSTITAEVGYLSSIGYFQDNTPPSLSQDGELKEFVTGLSVLKFKISDNGVGIDPGSISLTADNLPLKPSYNSETGILTLDSEGMTLKSGDYSLSLKVRDLFGNESVVKAPLRVAAGFTLSKVYMVPNPAGDVTMIHYTLGAAADSVTIKIYDASGKRVKTFSGDITAGSNFMTWDLRNSSGRKVSNGTYLIKLEAVSGEQRLQASAKLAVLQ